MDFCSNCGTRLTYDSNGKKRLYCQKCKKKYETSKEEMGKESSTEQSKSKDVDQKTLKLRTLPRLDADCYKCNCKKAETWALNLGSEDNSQAIFFRCVSCGHTWRQTE